MAYKRLLTAADDVLKFVAEVGNVSTVDRKFREVITLLSGFDLPSKDPTSDINISGTVTRKAKMADKSESISTTLYTLKKELNLYAKVKFPSVSLQYLVLTNPSQWVIYRGNQQGPSSFISLAPFLTPALSS
jgi:hypothetical protein